jgi:hypothetical protein
MMWYTETLVIIIQTGCNAVESICSRSVFCGTQFEHQLSYATEIFHGFLQSLQLFMLP